MASRSDEDFIMYLASLSKTLKPGRQRIRVVRDNLSALVHENVIFRLSDSERDLLFPLGFNPDESDLKIAAAVGLERKWLSPESYADALRADKALSPLSFLQTVSGKALGEKIAPSIAQYWIADPSDSVSKMPVSAYYDIGWQPYGEGRLIRIELKSSTESSPNFQQIRHPRMSQGADQDYDLLLCLGLSNEGIEWWVFPAVDVERHIQSGAFPLQHGGQKMDSGTYWVRMNKRNRLQFQSSFVGSQDLRARLLRA